MSNVTKIRDMLPPEVRKQWDEAEKREAKIAEQVRLECADAVELLALAIRHPRTSRVDLDGAQRKIARALSYAAALDPEEAA